MNLLTWLETEPNWKKFIGSRDIESLDQLEFLSPRYYFLINSFAFEINQKSTLDNIEKKLNINRHESFYLLRCLFGAEFETFQPITKKEKIDLSFHKSIQVIDLPAYYLKLREEKIKKETKRNIIFIALLCLGFFSLSQIKYLQNWKSLETKISFKTLDYSLQDNPKEEIDQDGEQLKVDYNDTKKLKARKSIYEESSSNRLRGVYHSARSYRVILNSISLDNSKETLDELIKKYKAKKVDKVEPGVNVPGGLYYNLYVNERRVKRLLEELQSKEEGIIYEGTSQRNVPKGMRRVFIWVKGI